MIKNKVSEIVYRFGGDIATGKIAGVHRTTVVKWRLSGRFPPIKIPVLLKHSKSKRMGYKLEDFYKGN